MQENNKKRIRLSDNSDFVWSQRRNDVPRKKDDKSVFSNTAKSDNVLYRSAKAAREAEEKLHAEKVNAPQNTQENQAKKIRETTNRHIREGQGVRDAMLRQERRLGMEGALSRQELNEAIYSSPTMIGKAKPMNVKKKDVRGLEGKRRRTRKARNKLLPSERRSRLARAKIERNRRKERDRMIKKELTITDSRGNKISVERLRKLRGLKAKEPIKRHDLAQARKMMKERQTETRRTSMVKSVRKREEYTR